MVILNLNRHQVSKWARGPKALRRSFASGRNRAATNEAGAASRDSFARRGAIRESLPLLMIQKVREVQGRVHLPLRRVD